MVRQPTPQDYINMLRRWWLLPASLAVLGGGAGYGITHFLPKRYVSQTTVLVEDATVPGDYVKPLVTNDLGPRLASMQQEILSRTSLESLIGQFGLYHADIDKVPMEDLVERLRKTITVTPMQPTAGTNSPTLPGFSISVTFDDPRLAQQICSTVVGMFTEENLKTRQEQAQETTDFLSKQLEDAKAKLDEQDSKLADFKRRYLGSLPDEEQSNLNLLANWTTQLDANTQALSRAQQDKSFAESMLAEQLASVQTAPDGQSPEALQQQLTTLQTNLADMQSKYTDDHPDVIKAKKAIEALQKKMAENEDQQRAAEADKPSKPVVELPQVQSLRAQIHQDEQLIHDKTAQQEEIDQQIKVYQDRVQSSPAVEQQYTELTRGYNTALEDYNALYKEHDQANMATDLERRQEGGQFTLLDPANLPDQPSFPKKPLFAAGGFGGGFALGLGIILLIEISNTSLRNEKDLESLVPWPVLVVVPAIEPFTKKAAGPHLLGQVLRT